MATRDSIKAAVQRLLAENATDALPINVERLAEAVGAVVTYEPFKEDLSGVLVKEGEKVVIGVNSSHPKTRQRFTVAHEIGHLILKHKGELFVDHLVMRRDSRSGQAIDRQEIEANRFAAELLMPEARVIDAAHEYVQRQKSPDTDQMIKHLSELFNVSTQAMEFRLTNLGVFMPQ